MITISGLKELAALTSYPEELKETLNIQEKRHPADVDYYRFFYQLSRCLKPKLCVELGTNLGVATSCLALGNPKGRVISLDISNKVKYPGCEQPNIEYLVQDSLAPIPKELKEIDILFIDTSSKGKQNKLEYEHWSPRVRKGGFIFIDDIFIIEDINGKITTDLMAEFWRTFEPSGIKFELPLHGVNGFGGVLLNA